MDKNTKTEEMSKDIIKKRKVFFVSDMDEEAEYLHFMSMSGYHFFEKKGIDYYFELGEVKNYYYHLGYYEHGLRDENRYVNNYKEAGWEDIFKEKSEFDGVLHYFRTEEPVGIPAPEIYSDRKSKKILYNRLLENWRNLITIIILFIVCMVGILYFLLTHPTIYQTIYLSIYAVVLILLLGSLAIYMHIYLKVKYILAELKYD